LNTKQNNQRWLALKESFDNISIKTSLDELKCVMKCFYSVNYIISKFAEKVQNQNVGFMLTFKRIYLKNTFKTQIQLQLNHLLIKKIVSLILCIKSAIKVFKRESNSQY